ncbi:MAG: DUF366 family protein [Bdellovibrionales bacterium]
MITTKFLTEEFSYKGPELRSLFLYEKGLKGDGVLSWIGPCDVKTDDLVDAEDRVTEDFIKSKRMVHFLCEFFHKDIFFGICIQRLMAEIVIDVLEGLSEVSCQRKGDDIYIDGKKLNVSIATVSTLSSLIHFGVNVDSEGAPVAAIGLKDLGVDPVVFVNTVLAKLEVELEDIYQASVKVQSV